MAVPRQVPVTLEEVTVLFSAEEWALLEEWQRELHREVMVATAQLLASLGEELALPSGAADTDGPQDAAAGRETRGPPGSASLCALVRLVRDIPQFLFGSSNGAGPYAAAGGDAAPGSELLGAGVKPEALAESSPLWSLERCLEKLPRGDPGPPRTTSSGEGHQAELRGLCSHGGKALVTPRFHQMEASKWTSMSTSIGDTGTEEQRGLEMSPALEEAPLRSLLRCLRAVAVQAPCRDPVGAALALSCAEASPRHCTSAGITVSPAENRVPGDSCPAGSTRPCARVPAMGTATRRPSMGGTERSPCSTRSATTGALRATSPLDSSAHPRACPGGVPASPREHCGCGGALELRAEVAQLRSVVVEKLHRLRRDVGTTQREVLGVRSRLARLEQGARGRARDVAALIRSRRCLRDAIRRLEGRCWARQSRAWHSSRALPGGSDAVTILQMVLPAVLGLALPRCGSGAADSSAAPRGLGAL